MIGRACACMCVCVCVYVCVYDFILTLASVVGGWKNLRTMYVVAVMQKTMVPTISFHQGSSSTGSFLLPDPP